MSAQFTPGPWRYNSEFPIVMCGHGNEIAEPFEVAGDEGARDANARLIAAAPELCETLAEARIHILDDSALARRIDAALAKVRGEQ